MILNARWGLLQPGVTSVVAPQQPTPGDDARPGITQAIFGKHQVSVPQVHLHQHRVLLAGHSRGWRPKMNRCALLCTLQ